MDRKQKIYICLRKEGFGVFKGKRVSKFLWLLRRVSRYEHLGDVLYDLVLPLRK